MAKTRLRNDDRDAIRHAVLDHKFTKLEARREADEKALGHQLYERVYDAKTRKAIAALPPAAFPTADYHRVAVNGQVFDVSWGEERPVFYASTKYHARALSVTDADALGAAIVANKQAEETLRDERRHMAGTVRATLAQFNTFDDLLAAWPEAEPFIKARWQTRPEYASNVPAVELKSLSAALDLPPEQLAQAA